MAALTVQKVTKSGVGPAYSAADAAGDTFSNDGNTMLHVKNGSAGSINVTIDSVAQCSFGFDHDIVVAVPAGGERMIGPFPRDRFGSPTSVTYSAATSVTVAAISVD